MNKVLEVNQLKKMYKNFQAVKNVSFSIKENECLSLLGVNGAGKTSTLKMIYSAISITGGSVKILGNDVQIHSKKAKQLIGVVSQEDLLDYSLNVIENMVAHAICYKIPKKKAHDKGLELLDFVGLTDYVNKEVHELSGGMRRRLVLARALINEPKLIILDEPTTGLDIQSRHLIWDKLLELKKKGISILLTSHYMDEVERLSDRLLIIDKGEIIAGGTPQELLFEYNFKNLEAVFLFLTSHKEGGYA